MKEEYKYAGLTELIIGGAMAVHRKFGPGFKEIIYERALEIELKQKGLNCVRQRQQQLFYRGEHVGGHRFDMLVEDLILIENKAISELGDIDFVKTVNYLKVFDYEIGLLLNFGAKSLQFRRFANKEATPRSNLRHPHNL